MSRFSVDYRYQRRSFMISMILIVSSLVVLGIVVAVLTLVPGSQVYTFRFEDKTTETMPGVAFSQTHDTINGSITAESNIIDLNQFVRMTKQAEWSVVDSPENGKELDKEKITLNEGDNVFYIKTKYRQTNKDYTLNIKFEYVRVMVSFSTDEGSSVDAQKIKKGTSPVKPSDPVKKGYIFDGWNTKEDGTGEEFSFEKARDKDTVAFAVWKPGEAQYKIQYMLENVTGSKYVIDESRTITKKGKTESYVTTEPEVIYGFESPSFVPKMRVEGDGSMILKLRYKRKSARVTFDSNGGEYIKYNTRTIRYGGKIEDVPSAVKPNYLFSHWVLGNDEGETYDMNTVYATEESLTDFSLYAKYVLISQIKYTVEVYQQNVEDNEYTLAHTSQLSGSTSVNVSFLTTSIKGFIKAQHKDEILSGVLKPDDSLVLRAYYNRRTFVVTFNPNVQGRDLEFNSTTVRFGGVIGDRVPAPKDPVYKIKEWRLPGKTTAFDTANTVLDETFLPEDSSQPGLTLNAQWEN